MSTELVKTGIDIIGSVPWGTHFCQFYQTKEDLLDTLVPYFKAGLENNEFCMWITSAPLSAEEASKALRRVIPDFADRLKKGQIEILPHTKWYLSDGSFDQQRVLDGWVDKLNAALATGYAGLRLTGNTFWLEKRDWKSFTDYEAAVNDVIGKYPMLALCTYSLDKCGAAEVMDVIRNHEFALIRKEGKWEIIENAVYKQAKDTLLESEKKYRQLMESLQEGVWVIDKGAYTTFVNPRMAEMLGYSVDEMVGKQLFSFIDESSLGIARERMERRRRGIKEEVEFLFRRKNGQPLWTLISAAPLTNVTGDFSGVIAGIVDITERKQIEERLAHLASFPELNPMFVVEMDRTGNANYANPATRRLFPDLIAMGAEHPYLAGIPELIRPGGEAPKDTQTIREIKIGEQYYQQVIMVTPDNQHVHIYGSDITERKKAEEGIRRAKEEWERTFDSVPDLIAILDDQHRIVHVNKAMAARLACTPEQCVGLHCYKVVHGTDAPPAFCPHAKTLTDQSEHIEEIREDRLGGDFLVSTNPILDSQGRMTGSVHVARDITERKRREDKILRLTRLYAVLSRANEAIVRIGDANSLCSEICRIVAEEGGFPLVWIGQEEEQHVVPLAWSGPAVDYLKEIRVEVQGELGRGPTGTCIRENRAVVNNDFATNTTVSPWQEAALSYSFRASAAFPLRRGGKVIGALSLYSFEPNTFDADQIRLLESLGSDVSYALDSIGQEERRIQAEETLRESEERLNRAQEIAHIGSWELDLLNNRLTWSDEVYRIFGLQPQESGATYEAFLEEVHPDDRPAVEAAYSRSIREGRDTYEIEHRIVRRSNSQVRIVYEKCQHFRDATGRIVRSVGMVHDITERKQAEEQLKFQANILYHVSDAVVAVDNDHRVTYWNNVAEDLYGVPAEQAIGQRAEDLYQQVWLNPRDEQNSAEDLTTKGHWTGENIHVKKNGERAYVRSSVSMIADEDGMQTGMVAVTRDRTKLWQAEQEVKLLNERLRQQTEDRLRATDASFRRAITSSADGIVVVRKDGIIRFANPAAEGLLGTEAVKMVGTSFGFPLAETTEIEIPKENSRKAIAEMRVVELDWEDTPAYLATLRDITRRKEVLLALQQSETRLRLLLEQIPCLSWTLDTKLRFTSFTGSRLETFKAVPDQILGTTLAEHFNVDNLDLTPYVEHRRALQGTPSTYELTWAGRTFYGRVESLRDADDRIVGVVGVAFDITERKEAEAHLRNLAHRLVTAQENERRKIARELHDEVGQSLTALKLCLDRVFLARSGTDGSELGVAREVLRELMARVRSMSLELRPTMLDDLGLLPTLLWHFKRYTAQTNVHVHFKHRGLRTDLPQDIMTTAYRIVQEALTNVARYAQVTEVMVCVRAELDALIIEVEDHGVGFDLDKVAPTSMGLGGMRERALSLNGKLLVQSTPAEGTCVIAELPLPERRRKRTRSKENDNRSSGG